MVYKILGKSQKAFWMTWVIFFCVGAFAFAAYPASASTKVEIEEMIAKKNAEIEALQKQIDAYSNDLASKKQKTTTIQEEIQRLASEIRKSELEIRTLNLAIDGIGFQIEKMEEQVRETEAKIDKGKGDLLGTLRLMERSEQVTPLELLITKPSFSVFFSDLYDLYFLQSSVKRRVVGLKDAKESLEEMKDQLGDELKERQELKTLEEMARARAAAKRNEESKTLSKVKKEATQITSRMKVVETDLSRLREQITYIVKSGVSVEDAIRYGELAAIRLGIRPGFLIALLEVESRLGLNVGKGTYLKDMHTRDHEAFFSITKKLNLDPEKTPVSRKPSYGWGGAMGPAQFLPNTWLAYEAEVARLTGHNPPSPWNIEDAFTAAAVKLSRQGAASKTRAGEAAAARAYIGGSPNCSKSICNFYANSVLDKAEEIEAELGAS
ncbi:MAG: lytic murein transglycosylase [Patescibacteria group bacterium]